MAFRIRKRNPPKLPPPHEIEKHIRNFSTIDLRTAEIDFLKEKLQVLFRGYLISTPVLSIGQMLYRGVRWTDKPKLLHQVSYPPPDKILTYQRANRPQQPMFYSSIAREGAIFELRPQPGDHIAVSKWRIAEKLMVNNVGYIRDVFDALKSNRSVPDWGNKDALLMGSESNLLVAKYFATQFSKIVPKGEEHEFKISIAIAEKHYLDDVKLRSPLSRGYGEATRFSGLIYPSISMRANADNVALLPTHADRFLVAVSVEWLRIDSRGPDFSYQVTMLDFANSFGQAGDIEWKGRLPQWKVSPGQTATAVVKNGHWVIRNEQGEVIEPS